MKTFQDFMVKVNESLEDRRDEIDSKRKEAIESQREKIEKQNEKIEKRKDMDDLKDKIKSEIKQELSSEAYDAEVMGRSQIRKTGEGGRIGADRTLPDTQKRRMKFVKDPETGEYKRVPSTYKGGSPKAGAGESRGEKGPAPGRPAAGKDGEASTRLKPGTAGTLGSATMTPKERQRKAYLERQARKSGEEQPKTASQAISQATKPKSEEKPSESKPKRRQWKTESGEQMNRQQVNKARSAERTAASQKLRPSYNEILAKMRKEYEEGGGKWSNAVAVRMRAKAKAAAKASQG